MRIKNIVVVGLITVGIFGTSAVADGTHWGYTGHVGPDAWGHLSPKYKECSQGKNQSPIDIISSVNAHLPPLTLKYDAASTDIVNNGHTIQLNFAAGNILTIDGIDFELKQFHFHTPSENHIEGKSFPLEAHFVHLDKEGNIAVVALMFQEGEENEVLAKVWEKMPEKSGERSELKLADIAKALLPKDLHYYRFNGSLTTPPCTEGVRWMVLKTPVSISKEEVEKFKHIMHHANNRPTQPIDARMVVE